MELKSVILQSCALLAFLLTVFILSIALKLVLPHSAFISPVLQSYCKPIPGEPDWPTASEWNSLNESISGQLIAPIPSAIVCVPSSSTYDESACSYVRSQWTNSTWHGRDPFSSSYNDETCLPDPRTPCTPDGYPSFVVNATTAQHVQEGLKFAHRTGVRLVVKGTGHDFIGRSAGRNALSIYTYNIRGIEFNKHDERARKYGGEASMKVLAGTVMSDYYAAAVKHNVTVVGGADMNVGIGGWLTNGGHSPVSSKYGLGADQALEMEVVTANGTLLTINEDAYPELFWGMRGGGGSTFGIMISVTMKVYPDIPITSVVYSYNTTANSDTFWSLTAYFHSRLSEWNDKGAMGYYFITPSASTTTLEGTIAGLWLLPDRGVAEANSMFDPFEHEISNGSLGWADEISVRRDVVEYPSFSTAWMSAIPPALVGYNIRLGSRLLDRNALAIDQERMKKQLKQTTFDPGQQILGHVVAGNGVKNAKVPGGSNAVLPAWRNAITHIVLPRRWNYLDEEAKTLVTSRLRDIEIKALCQLAPSSGAYLNEADPTETLWKEVYFGVNYPRLLMLKNHWDPTGVFWCRPCVGHDQWTIRSDKNLEGAVGQNSGRICRL